MRLQTDFQHIDATVAVNNNRVACAMRGSTPTMNLADYEAVLDEVVAQVMGTECALASMRLLSGVLCSETIQSGLFHVHVDRQSKQ